MAGPVTPSHWLKDLQWSPLIAYCLQQYTRYSNEEANHCHVLHRLYGKINFLRQCHHAILLDIII